MPPSLPAFRHQPAPDPRFRVAKAWSCHQEREARVRSTGRRGRVTLGSASLVQAGPRGGSEDAAGPAPRWARGCRRAQARMRQKPTPQRAGYRGLRGAGWDGALTAHGVPDLAARPPTNLPAPVRRHPGAGLRQGGHGLRHRPEAEDALSSGPSRAPPRPRSPEAAPPRGPGWLAGPLPCGPARAHKGGGVSTKKPAQPPPGGPQPCARGRPARLSG